MFSGFPPSDNMHEAEGTVSRLAQLTPSPCNPNLHAILVQKPTWKRYINSHRPTHSEWTKIPSEFKANF